MIVIEHAREPFFAENILTVLLFGGGASSLGDLLMRKLIFLLLSLVILFEERNFLFTISTLEVVYALVKNTEALAKILLLLL
jgi:hypothetical protein